MSLTERVSVNVGSPDRIVIGGTCEKPSTWAAIDVVTASIEDVVFRLAEAKEGHIDRAIAAAPEAVDRGPWQRMSYAERGLCARARWLRRSTSAVPTSVSCGPARSVS
jgi:acyl-CoA reductase-like NAD-dependent aldehyde dehydrogenase